MSFLLDRPARPWPGLCSPSFSLSHSAASLRNPARALTACAVTRRCVFTVQGQRLTGKLRRATEQDVDEIVEVLAATNAGCVRDGCCSLGCLKASPVQAELTSAISTVLVSDCEGRVDGAAICWSVAGEAQVLAIAVAESARRQGLGGRLLEAALAKAWGGIPGPAVLEVRESNVAAINLYKRHGFTEVGRRKKFYPDGEGAVLMNREAGLQGAPWSGGSDEGEDRKKAAEAAAAVEPLLPGGGGRR